MKICIACGMPMTEASDFALGDMKRDYCVHCADTDGNMQSINVKKAGLAAFIVKTQGFDLRAAEEMAEEMMKRLPAWKDQLCNPQQSNN